MSISVNLLPQSVRLSQHRRRLLVRWAAVWSLALCALIVPYSLDQNEQTRTDRVRGQQEQLRREIADLKHEVQAAASQADRVLRQLRRAKAMLAKRRWTGVFSLIAGAMPDQCWLEAVSTDPVTPPPTASATRIAQLVNSADAVEKDVTLIDSPRRIRISGFSIDASRPHQMVSRLKQSGSFDHCALEGVEREAVGGEEFFRFDLTCEW